MCVEGLCAYLETLIDKLVSTGDELQAVDVVELCCDLVAEEPASTTRRNSPGLDVLRITPDQITEGTLMRDLLSTSNNTNLIDSADLRAQPTVDTKDLTIDNGSKNKEIEDLAARLPDRGVTVLLLTLLVEAVDLSNLAGLVVATDEGDLVGVPEKSARGKARRDCSTYIAFRHIKRVKVSKLK